MRNLIYVACGALLAALPPAAYAQTSPLDSLARSVLSRIDGTIQLPGLKAEAEVIRDRWGIPHIYASNVDDLFFLQGFVVAQDRLWQMEMWRRQKDGTLAEILGPRAVERDRIARLTMYRGPMDDAEYQSYHPEAKRILTAFAAGVNAFIDHAGEKLPVEFLLTGVRPERWTAATPTLRETGFGSAGAELRLARDVARLGLEEVRRRQNTTPRVELVLPRGLDVSIIGDDVIASLSAGGAMPRPEILPQYRALVGGTTEDAPVDDILEPGSNNWVVSGRLSATGKPLVANDPHRAVTLPALRYIVRLNAPGWNVIGGGEPAIPGVAIGHNDHIAWGLTIVGTDQHDVFVEEVNPSNRMQVRYDGAWEAVRVVHDTIRVKGEAPRIVELEFTRHGPVFHRDTVNHRAYVLRSALHERGTAPYLGSLRLNQTRDCREFLDHMHAWKAPSENMICGDVDGNISWEAAAITPNRTGWFGRLPVPGTGEYRWDGFRTELPRELNPERGWIATANNDIHPSGFHPPVMFKSLASNSRFQRLEQLLESGAPFTVADFKRMQLDAWHRTGAADVARFRGWTSPDARTERARQIMAEWDGVLSRESVGGAIHQEWRPLVDAAALRDETPRAQRDSLVALALDSTVARLERSQGPDMSLWSWGRGHTRSFPHAFVREFDLPTVERGGGAGTVAADGATYREILDVSDWDRSVATSTPGQSGQPGSPFYGNLLPLWANDEYFPLVFSRAAVEREAAHRLVLRPGPR
jgi:penicillin G amidase